MKKYRKGKKVTYNGGVAKITSVNPDGTATLNWVTPPRGVKKGTFAGTLPAISETHVEKMVSLAEEHKSDSSSEYHNIAQKHFDEQRSKLKGLYEEQGQGAVRYASGDLFETMIDKLVGAVGGDFESKVGQKDFITTRYEHPTMGIIAEQDNLQVDRHIWRNGERYAFVEAKTYLDKPYLERAVSDFLEIKRALDMQGEPTKHLKFIVFAGQNAIADNSLQVQKARFWTESAVNPEDRIDMQVVFVVEGKRDSSKPLYDNNFMLKYDEVDNFVAEFTEGD